MFTYIVLYKRQIRCNNIDNTKNFKFNPNISKIYQQEFKNFD